AARSDPMRSGEGALSSRRRRDPGENTGVNAAGLIAAEYLLLAEVAPVAELAELRETSLPRLSKRTAALAWCVLVRRDAQLRTPFQEFGAQNPISPGIAFFVALVADSYSASPSTAQTDFGVVSPSAHRPFHADTERSRSGRPLSGVRQSRDGVLSGHPGGDDRGGSILTLRGEDGGQKERRGGLPDHTAVHSEGRPDSLSGAISLVRPKRETRGGVRE
ncbi:hypothetical protein HPB47_023698, partial [Ixodes persulcatus]